MKERSYRALSLVAIVAIAIGFTFAMTAPRERIQGEFAKIMFVHVPSAWLAFLAFAVTAIAGIVWLIKRTPAWDRIAASSAEVGVFFTALALMTGMIWGYPVWGTFWDWSDARLMSTAIMFFVYLGYLALRRSVPDPETRARRSAILGIIAFIQVPLVYFSVTLFRTLHQGATVVRADAPIDPAFFRALMVNVGAFTVVYAAFMVWRTRLAQMEDELEEAEAVADFEIAGSGITAPELGGVPGDV
jgi:heme exporter protein C